jgi:hypothetical protein
MPKLVAGWILGIHDVFVVRVRFSLFVNRIVIEYRLSSILNIFSWIGKAVAFEAIECWFDSNEMFKNKFIKEKWVKNQWYWKENWIIKYNRR